MGEGLQRQGCPSLCKVQVHRCLGWGSEQEVLEKEPGPFWGRGEGSNRNKALISCRLSEPQFPHLRKGAETHLIRQLGGRIRNAKALAGHAVHLAHRRPSKKGSFLPACLPSSLRTHRGKNSLLNKN